MPVKEDNQTQTETALMLRAALLLFLSSGILMAQSIRPWEAYMPGDKGIEKLVLTEEEWRERLTEPEYHVLREKGTERAFSGEYADLKDGGVYCCRACGLALFSSEAKYDSGTGWPSYWEPISADHVQLVADWKLFYKRTEVRCARCDSHIGHVFNDGPEPTGQRWCMNSIALHFVPEAEWEALEQGEKE